MKKLYFYMSFLCLLFLMFTTSCSKEALTPLTSNTELTQTIPSQMQPLAATTTDDELSAQKAKAGKFKVIGYVMEWTGNLNEIQYDKLTHINYAFALPTKTGGLSSLENVSKLTSLVKIAHSKNVKVLLSIGGWNNGDDNAFRSISQNMKYKINFANTLLKTIKQYNLDGVDIDWETPKHGVDNANFTSMMFELNQTIRGNNKILSIAVPPTNTLSIQNKVFDYVDFFNIMAYDSFLDLSNHSSYNVAVMALNYWKGRGLPANKAILGVPFYGRSRKGWDFTSYEMYNDILKEGALASDDSYNGTCYNGIKTIQNKTKLALSQGGGVMIWELSGDVQGKNSLLTAIDQTIKQ